MKNALLTMITWRHYYKERQEYYQIMNGAAAVVDPGRNRVLFQERFHTLGVVIFFSSWLHHIATYIHIYTNYSNVRKQPGNVKHSVGMETYLRAWILPPKNFLSYSGDDPRRKSKKNVE